MAKKKQMLLLIPPVLLLAVCIFHEALSPIAKAIGDLYTCPLRLVTGLHCPGCGGTRSMLELLHGHPLRAVHDNPAAPVLVILAILRYSELVLESFGKKVHLFPRSVWFWGVVIGIHMIWAIARLFIPALLPLPLS